MDAETWLLVGLGNPGPEYDATRHNIGFMVADIVAGRHGVRFKRSARHRALVAESREGDARVVLAKPQTYVNESGQAIASLGRFHRVEVERTIVVHDELDLAFAKLRVRVGGGTAGHNGLKSIVAAIGPEFVRVRVGIGRPPGRQDPASYVLAPFRKSEREEIDAVLETAADAALTVVREGAAAAQNLFNRSDPTAAE